MLKSQKHKPRRTMMVFSWSPAWLKAFRLLADRFPVSIGRKNGAALARAILEQWAFSVLDLQEAVKLGLVSPWDAKEGQYPRPSLLRLALSKHDGRKRSKV